MSFPSFTILRRCQQPIDDRPAAGALPESEKFVYPLRSGRQADQVKEDASEESGADGQDRRSDPADSTLASTVWDRRYPPARSGIHEQKHDALVFTPMAGDGPANVVPNVRRRAGCV